MRTQLDYPKHRSHCEFSTVVPAYTCCFIRQTMSRIPRKRKAPFIPSNPDGTARVFHYPEALLESALTEEVVRPVKLKRVIKARRPATQRNVGGSTRGEKTQTPTIAESHGRPTSGITGATSRESKLDEVTTEDSGIEAGPPLVVASTLISSGPVGYEDQLSAYSRGVDAYIAGFHHLHSNLFVVQGWKAIATTVSLTRGSEPEDTN